MSKPTEDYQDKLGGALMELNSALSSLNMHPEPLEVSREVEYLSETDKWANHAYSHIEAAIQLICNERRQKDEQ